MIKVDVASADLDKQMELLKYYPELVEKHFRPAIFHAVNLLKKGLKAIAPQLTGKAVSSIRSKVSGKGISMIGSVYFGDKGWYMRLLNDGVKRHPVIAKADVSTRKWAGWETRTNIQSQAVLIAGEWKTMTIHPGIGSKHFVERNLEDNKGAIDQIFIVANQAVLNELVVK